MSYGWVRMEMTIRNRDRRGGHECTELPSLDWAGIATSPTARKLAKKQSRKEMRREHAKLIREELSYRNIDLKADREEEIRLNQEADDAWYAELAAEYEYGLSDDEAYELDHPGYRNDNDFIYYPYDDNPYDNEDLSYVGGSLSKQGLTSFDMNARIKDEDVGRPLGDVLQDILNKRN